MHTLRTTLRHWASGIRLYIALASLLVTGLIIWWAHTAYGGTTLFPSRIEETFAWLATGLIIAAISIGPLMKLFPGFPAKGLLFDARRMIGISAAWFAALHTVIAYSSQFKLVNPFSLPSLYQRSFVFGGIALIILLAMAATSFDAAFKGMGKWWFRLHRFVYVAVVAILIHAFLTGVHATQSGVLITLAILALSFVALYARLWSMHAITTNLQRFMVVVMAIAVVGALGFGISRHEAQMKAIEYGVVR